MKKDEDRPMNTNRLDILKKMFNHLKSTGKVHTQTELANLIQYNKTNLSSAFNGNERYLTLNLLKNINQTFNKEFSEDWLVTGKGDMLNPSEIKPISNVEFLNIPFLPIHAQAGYGRGYGDHEYIESLPTYPVIVDKNYKGKYRVFEVDGDSMDDGTRNAIYYGDKVLCREVKRELWTSKLHYKDWYFVICMKNDGITIKQITAHDVEKAIIRCHPLNPIFDDFEVDLNEVAELYNVIKIVERSARL